MTQSQRPDQRQLGTSRAGVGPAPGGQFVIARIVVIYGTGTTGWFEYSGSPGAGNEPIAYAVPPGVTKDPYGNVLPASGGVVSQDAGVAFSQLISGGLIVGLIGAIESSQDAVLGISGSSSGQGITLTSGAGPEAGAQGSTLSLGDSGAGGVLQVTSGADGSTYDTMRLTIETAVPLDVDSTSPVTLFTFPVAEGTYAYQLEIPMLGTGTGIPQLRFSSLAAVVSQMQGETFLDGGTAGGYTAYQTALNTFGPVGPPLVNADANRLTGSGIFTFSTAGTILVEMDASTSVPTCTIPVGARMHLYPVTGLAGSGGGGAGQVFTPDWANVRSYGADFTGATDSTAAFTAAYDSGLPVYIPKGTYKIAGNLAFAPPVTIIGDGISLVTLDFTGTGDCLRINTATALAGFETVSLTGFTIDGTSAAAGSSGLHMGDTFQPCLDIAINNFQGAGSKGAWFDNQYNACEQMTGKLYVRANTSCVVFDNSADISGEATGSFDRTILDVFIDSDGVGNGITFQNGAFIIDGRLGMYGNFSPGASQYAALTITGSNVAGYSLISQSVINIGAELATTAGTAPYTINFGSAGNNVIDGCSGIMDFGAHAAFASAQNFLNSFLFDGPVYGDPVLWRSVGVGQLAFSNNPLTNGATIGNRYSSLIRVSAAASVTGIIMEGFNPDEWRTITVMNIGPGSVTFDVAATSHVADGIADVIAADTAATFHWDVDEALWFRAY
jgi:hypothetical protein